MTALEIVLIIIGLVFILGSFLVTEKLSQSEIKHIAELSAKEIDGIIERHMEKAGGRIESAVDENIDESIMKIERKMDKEANEKMMAISEYSDTVLESINKSHNEIMFLYSMLNEKHDEIVNFANGLNSMLSETQKQMETDREMNEMRSLKEQEEKETERQNKMQETAAEAISEDSGNDEDYKRKIIELYMDGMQMVDIARTLGVGLGEVQLIINLHQGA